MQPETENNQVENQNSEQVQTNDSSPVVTTNTQTPIQASPVAEPPAKRRRFLKWLIALVVIILVAAAAFWLVGRSDNKTPTTQSQKKTIPLLRVGYTSGPLNQFYPGGFNYVSNFIEVNNQIFEGLVRYEDKSKLAPALATSWSNPDNSTWIFDLRPNVKFHTGRTMTSSDVKSSLDTAKANPDLELFTSTIKTVETMGNGKVKIITDGPDSILLNKLTYLYIYDSISNKKDDPINGTGPYTLKPGSTPKKDLVELTAFDGYHGGKALTRELALHWYEGDQAAVKDFNEGKLDFIGYLGHGAVQKLKEYLPYTVEPAGTHYITINNQKTNSPLSKLEFRKGLEYLIDRQRLINAEIAGGQPADQLVPQEIPGHNTAIKAVDRNVDQAKKLFAAAGYPNGATLNFLHSAVPQEAIKEIQRQFAEGGISLVPENIEDFDAFLSKAQSAEADLAYQGFASDFLDGSDFVSAILESPDFYRNAQLSALNSKIGKTFDPTERLALLKQASKVMADDVAVLPVYYLKDTFAMNKPYVFNQDNPAQITQVYFWKAYLE